MTDFPPIAVMVAVAEDYDFHGMVQMLCDEKFMNTKFVKSRLCATKGINYTMHELFHDIYSKYLTPTRRAKMIERFIDVGRK